MPIILYTGLEEKEKRVGIRREELLDTVVGAVECYVETLKAIKSHTEPELKENKRK